MTIPLVSICCLTYNHAPYIRQCLDGFIMQKTNFPIEVLIHDDASTDSTADIIREYEQKYPEIIKPIYQTDNQRSKGIPISRIYNFPRAQGKYLATCEGDDYWIDKYKLQRQVDFMEQHDDFSICFHPVKRYIQNKHRFAESDLLPGIPEVTDIKLLAVEHFICTPSVLYRKNQQVFDELNDFPRLGAGDYFLNMLFAKHGKIFKIPRKMAVYRVHEGGIWSMKDIKYTHILWLKVLEAFLTHFSKDQEIVKILKEQYLKVASRLLNFYIGNNDYDSQQSLCNQIDSQLHENSFLIFNKLVNNLNDEIHMLKNSKTYRLGRMLLSPLRVVRHLWRTLA